MEVRRSSKEPTKDSAKTTAYPSKSGGPARNWRLANHPYLHGEDKSVSVIAIYGKFAGGLFVFESRPSWLIESENPRDSRTCI